MASYDCADFVVNRRVAEDVGSMISERQNNDYGVYVTRAKC